MDLYTYLIEHDIKPSVQRIAIMNYLVAHHTHPTADEIYTALHPSIPTISKTTIYNTLKLFSSQGVAQTITIDEDMVHFDADTSVHGHFLCKKCGRIYDIMLSDEAIPGLKSMKKLGDVVEDTYIYYKGVCKNCLR